MREKIQNIFINLKLLSHPYFVILVVLSQLSFVTLIAKQHEQNGTTQNRQKQHLFFNSVKKVSNKTQAKANLSVKKFGAVGDGIADDTRSIQATIDAVSKAGGGVVFFPAGIYKVSINPKTLHAFTIRAKVTLQGEGQEKSIIKLADAQGNYDAILAGEKPNSNLSDFSMYDIAIDGNSSNNPVLASSDLQAETMRYSVRIYIGSRINIERNRFTNQRNVNVISVNGNDPPNVLVSDVSIKHNIFELIGGGDVDYDHSTIYSHGERVEIANNYFHSASGAGVKGARTAIEIHGDEHAVKNNLISGYISGIFVTGYAYSSNNQVIVNNTIKDVYYGIMIWSYFSWGNRTKPAISNCTIANNKINLNVDGWLNLWGDTASTGILLEANSDAPLKKLDILNNDISFTHISQPGRHFDNLANGIRLWRSAKPNVLSENIRIVGNKIKNSLAAGIYLSMPVKGGEILKNTIINAGQSNGDFNDNYRAAIVVGGKLNKVKVNQNYLIDNQALNTTKIGIFSYANCVGNCEAYKNYLHVKNGAKLQMVRYKFKKGKGFKISH